MSRVSGLHWTLVRREIDGAVLEIEYGATFDAGIVVTRYAKDDPDKKPISYAKYTHSEWWWMMERTADYEQAPA